MTNLRRQKVPRRKSRAADENVQRLPKLRFQLEPVLQNG